MIYKLVQLSENIKNSAAGKWFAQAVHYEDPVDLAALSEHMSNHNTPYSAGVIKGVLTDMVSCIRELVLEGKTVQIPDLASFYIGIKSDPADSAEAFTVAGNVLGFRLRVRALGEFTSSELDGKVSLKRLDQIGVSSSSSSATSGDDAESGE